jgi:single-strand DNA-binding protein
MDTHITVQGNLVADPVQHLTASGAVVVSIRIASNTRRYDKNSGEFRDGDPLYIGVSCWRNLGGNVMATLRKGDSVVVHGRLQYREYDDKAGVRRNVHEVDALALGPDLSRWPADLRRPSRPDAASPAPAAGDDGAGRPAAEGPVADPADPVAA